MKIASSGIGMSSSSLSAKSYSAVERTTIDNSGMSRLSFVGAASSVKMQETAIITTSGAGAQGLGFNNAPQNGGNDAALLSLTPDAQRQAFQNEGLSVKSAKPGFQIELPDKQRMMLMMLERLTEALTGRKHNFKTAPVNPFENASRAQGYAPVKGASQTLAAFNSFVNFKSQSVAAVIGAAAPQPQAAVAAVATVQKAEAYHELQRMSFRANGVVNTEDGRQIQIAMNVSMSYEFYSQSSTTIQRAVEIGDLCDPLVINFDGALPEFTDERYAFDINIGGDKENIYMPTGGSGFLAYDKNGNGTIDDGSELFGAMSGNGFAELAAYDGDGNGWIDENDAIFDELKIMSVDKKTGEFMLVSLKDAGIGAIFLGSVASNYEINNANHETQGIVRRNGFFLFENGGAGSIQHIDLTY